MDEKIMDCAVVQDLAALYVDGGARAATAALVEEHLHACPACREHYKKYRRSGANRRVTPQPAAMDAAPGDGYARLARRLRRRSALERSGFVLGALALAVAGFAAARLLERAETD